MDREIRIALTEGLVTGYGSGKPGHIDRAGFNGRVSHFEQGNTSYHDEWFVGNRVGGGQELVVVNEKKFTRLYAGGTPGLEVLESLGITAKDVNEYLKRKIIELGERTRLTDNCIPEPDGEWQYAYRVPDIDDGSIGVTTGIESIDYRDTRVHVHAFILSPIE